MKTAKLITIHNCKNAIKRKQEELSQLPYIPFTTTDLMEKPNIEKKLLSSIVLYNTILDDLNKEFCFIGM